MVRLRSTRGGVRAAIRSWPIEILGGPPSRREVETVCLLVLAGVLLALGWFVVRASLGLVIGGDFIGFYTPGRLLNEHPPEQLYDFALQERVLREVRPSETFLALPYVHAPFEALLFAALARLSYESAYFAWLGLGALAYTGVLLLLIRRFGPLDPAGRRTAVLVSWSFMPFVVLSWLGGNVAVLAFVALSSAVLLDDAGHPVLAGVALSLCLNKPSLLVLVLPMLLVSGRIAPLAGFAAGAAGLVLLSSLVLGPTVWWRFVATLFQWVRDTSGVGVFTDSIYVDLNAFFRMAPGGRTWPGLLLMAGYAAWTLVRLVRGWVHARGDRPGVRRLAWASAITWTLVLNLYVPIYDCTLLVLVGLVTAAVMRDPADGALPVSLQSALLLCYGAGWIALPVARTVGVQVYTLALVAAGHLLIRELRRRAVPDTAVLGTCG